MISTLGNIRYYIRKRNRDYDIVQGDTFVLEFVFHVHLACPII